MTYTLTKRERELLELLQKELHPIYYQNEEDPEDAMLDTPCNLVELSRKIAALLEKC